MFGLFKKRNQASAADDFAVLSQQACSDIKEKWVYFNNTIHFKAGVSLAQRVEAFAQPVSQFFRESYPQLSLSGSKTFWLITFTAIAESGTHPASEVSTAMAQIQKQYGPAQ